MKPKLNNSKRIYLPDTIMTFGKYKRLTISYIQMTDKRYYNWLKTIINIKTT